MCSIFTKVVRRLRAESYFIEIYYKSFSRMLKFFFFQAEDGIRDGHVTGVQTCALPILQVAGRHGIPVVEDNAHGLFGKYKGRYLGTFGCLATLSFHETKNFTCGEGGALRSEERRVGKECRARCAAVH